MKFSLIGWVVSILFFVFIAVPVGIGLYSITNLIYAIKKVSQFFKKKTIKNEQAQFKSIPPKSIS
jgi:hypothetical protein